MNHGGDNKMSKYLEFKEIPFKGKTKRFEVVSKTRFEGCIDCKKSGRIRTGTEDVGIHIGCLSCFGTGETPIILGRIQWYSQWRQYTFSPGFPTTWNRDCLKDVQDFLQQLMDNRKILLLIDKESKKKSKSSKKFTINDLNKMKKKIIKKGIFLNV